MRPTLALATAVMVTTLAVAAQDSRPASPTGSSATQVAGEWAKSKNAQGQEVERYQSGKWVEITYGRPILKGRKNIFGSGADYGKTVYAGAPVWRAGADVTTRLKTEVPLQIGGKIVPAGEYSVFIELKENNWTLILSTWPAQQKYDPNNKAALWGAYNYTPDKDVARVQMTVGKAPFNTDELTWNFVDMTQAGGKLAIMWDDIVATAPFTVAK
jgi:Protein of unknown function (DUF2911)